jgi:hypothetical protein
MGKSFVGDKGTKIVIDCGSDISMATVTQLKVQKPDGTLVVWNCAKEDDTHLSYITQTGDLDQKGKYYTEAYIEMPGWSGTGELDSFYIHEVVL